MLQPFPVEILVGSIIAGGFLIVLVAIVGGLMHARRSRLLIHAERMKALELGREVPDDAGTARIKAMTSSEGDDGRSLAGRCFSVAGQACFWGFLFAIGAAAKDGGNSAGTSYAIAAATGAVGVTGLICGTILATRTPAPAAAKRVYDTEGV